MSSLCVSNMGITRFAQIIPQLRNDIIEIDLSNNYLDHLGKLPTSVLLLNLNNNKFHGTFNTSPLPTKLSKLYVNNNGIFKFDGSALDNLDELDISHNFLINFECPNALKINLSFNSLRVMKHMPNDVIILNLKHNQLAGTFNTSVLSQNLVSLDISENRIEHFDGSALVNLTNLNISNNSLEIIIFPPHVTKIDISDCQLSHIPELPITVEYFDCNDNYLEYLPDFPSYLTYANCAKNKMDNLPKINEGLIEFHCNNNSINSIDDLPNSIQTLNGSNNFITHVTHLPQHLCAIDLTNNELVKLRCELPLGLKTLILSKNMLHTIPPLPNGIENIVVDDNQLNMDSFTYLPMSVQYVNISLNLIRGIPDCFRGINVINESYDDHVLNESHPNVDKYYDSYTHVDDYYDKYYHDEYYRNEYYHNERRYTGMYSRVDYEPYQDKKKYVDKDDYCVSVWNTIFEIV